MTLSRAIYVLFRHYVIYPVYSLLLRVYYFPYYLLNKTALAVAYLWLYISHAPYFIRNAFDPEYADEESWNDLLKVVMILSTIGYITFYLNRI